MTTQEVVTERSVPLHIKLAILCIVLAPLCVGLAILELTIARGRAADIPAVALLAIANVVPLAALGLRYVRFERRWIAPVAFANAVILLGLGLAPTMFSSGGRITSGPSMTDLRSDMEKAGIAPVQTDAQHIDRSDRGPDGVKETIQKTLDKSLNETESPRPPSPQMASPASPQMPAGSTEPPSPDVTQPQVQTGQAPPQIPRITPPMASHMRSLVPKSVPMTPQATPMYPVPGGVGSAASAFPPNNRVAKASPAAPSASIRQENFSKRDSLKPMLPFDMTTAPSSSRLAMERMAPASANTSKTTASFDPLNDAATAAPQPNKDAASTTGNAKGVYWNTWLDNSASANSKNMIAGNTYTLTLDLSAYDYAALRKVGISSSVSADPLLKDVLKDENPRDIYLTVKPVVPEGSGLRLRDLTDSYFKKIDRERLRNPDTIAERQYREKQIGIVDLSRRVSAVSFPIVVTAEAAGCATIAFSIFNGYRPLDHLVQRIAIGDSATSAPTCDIDDPNQDADLSGGLDSLREVNLGVEGSTPSLTAAGAFHIFESDSFSMAVFVDGRRDQSQSVYGWQTDGSVIDLLRKDSFQALIQKARKDSANKVPGSYVPAARELEKVLFRAKPGTAPEATKAETAFRNLVRNASEPPVIVVRVASRNVEGQNRSLYLPLGILGAQGPDAVLDKPIVVVQPMAIERSAPKDRCIGEWTFAVPPKLQEVPDTVMPANFFPAKFPGTRLSKIDQFRPYLATTPAPQAGLISAAGTTAAIGFVVLAHQDDGNLWFDQSTDHIVKQDIDRSFPLGSVGIFAACSVASPKGRNNELLQKLNERGVDTMIVSPFAIDALYGITFAASFAETLQDATDTATEPTILELYNRAIAKTAQKFKAKNNGDYADLGLEYVLLGNSAITLCKPATPSGIQ